MPECRRCGTATNPGYDCSYCGGHYCPDHRVPETHDCDGTPQPPDATGESDDRGGRVRITDLASGSASRQLHPSKRVQRATAASVESGGTASESTSDNEEREDPGYEPELESSPDVAPDGSIVREGDQPELDADAATGGIGWLRGVYYRIRGTALAPVRLVQTYAMPILAILFLLVLIFVVAVA